MLRAAALHYAGRAPRGRLPLIAIALFVFGILIGSFANVCILRIPVDESIVSPGSRCPKCRAPVAWYDNVPLLSWIALRGRCRHCAEPISFRYFVVELLTGLAALAIYARFGFGIEWLVWFGFAATMIVITFIDLDHRIIPDVISLPGMAVGFVLSFRGWPAPTPVSSAIGILFGAGILLAVAWGYHTATGREGMGGGDIKLLGMIGAFLGWQSVPFTMLVSSLSGSIVGLSLMWWTKSDTKYAIPFGPFLAFAAVLYLFCGEQLIAWYLGLGAG